MLLLLMLSLSSSLTSIIANTRQEAQLPQRYRTYDVIAAFKVIQGQ